MAAPEQDPAVVAREKEQVLELRAAGKTFRYIAEQLGRSVATAHLRFDQALNEARRAKATEYMELHVARYEWQYDQLRQRHDTGEVIEKLSPHLAQVLAGERALLGLDAPKRINVSSSPEEDGAAFSEVAALAESDAAAEEKELRDGGDPCPGC